MPITREKAAARAGIRAGRRERPDDQRAAAGRAIAEQARSLLPPRPGVVGAYLSMPTEPPTDALIDMARSLGHRVVVPRIEGRDLAWVALELDTALAAGPMGIREPVGPAISVPDVPTIDVLLLPGLAVDRRGRRLGQGGGFYDRLLAAVPRHDRGGPLLAVVLFDDEVLDDVPADHRDRPVDVAVTPSAVIRLDPGAGSARRRRSPARPAG